MPMMNVLHVSYFADPQSVTRVVVGCKSLANKLDEDFRTLGYSVWMTCEENPERDADETERAMNLVSEAMALDD